MFGATNYAMPKLPTIPSCCTNGLTIIGRRVVTLQLTCGRNPGKSNLSIFSLFRIAKMQRIPQHRGIPFMGGIGPVPNRFLPHL